MDVSLFIGNIFHDFVCGGVWARIVESEWVNNGDGFTRRQHGSQFLRLVKGSGEQCGLSWKVFFHYDIIIVVTVLNRTKIASLWRSLPAFVKPDSSAIVQKCTCCTVGCKYQCPIVRSQCLTPGSLPGRRLQRGVKPHYRRETT